MSARCLAGFAALILATTLFAEENPVIAPTNWRSPADEKKAFHLPPGFEAQLVVSEPDILKPMQMAFDIKGRLWVPVSREYPFAAIGRKCSDRLMVLSDFGPDGKARKIETFADDLNIPIGVQPLPDGKTVLVSSIDPGPEGAKASGGCWIWELKDTKGTGKADSRRKLYGPFGTRDTHGMVNSFTLMPDGWVYACHGFSNESHVKGADGHEVTMQSGSTFRFRPDGSRIEVFTRGQVNPFGMCYDKWFNLYNADCHSRPMTQLIRGSVYQSFGKPHDGLGYGPDMIRHDHGSTGLCGLSIYEAENYPAEFQGGIFLGNVTNSRINWDKLKYHGSTPESIEQPDFLVSDDFWFRPVDIKLGPDGALYVSDFYNKIIGHYEVDLKDPRRDRTSGRIWRIAYTGKGQEHKAPGDLTKMKREDVDALLGSSNITVRMLATHALINWPDDEKVQEELKKAGESADRYDAHKMWVDEAEPLVRRDRSDKMKKLHEASTLGTVHRLRLRTAHAEWEADRERRGREKIQRAEEDVFKIGGDPQIARVLTDWMTAVPNAKNVPQLIAQLRTVPPEDTHLRHATRVALRETLRDPAGWTALKGLELDSKTLAMVADVATGLQTKDASDFLTGQLKTLSGQPDKLPIYIEHAARHGDGVKSLFAFISTHKPEDVPLTVAMFHSYVRGLQQKGGTRFDKQDFDFAEGLVGKGLTSADGATVLRCYDLATGLKLKASADAVATEATKKDRPENLRGGAFTTLIALDTARGVVLAGQVLASAEEPIAVREKAAQALVSAGTPEAYKEVLATLEKAPARLQTSIALALAGQQAGAKHLLNTVSIGKASARLLQDRAVNQKLLETKLPGVGEQIATLTKNLPSIDQKMAELMGKRRDGFGKAKKDADAGKVIFKSVCANCHQIGGEGSRIAPQLDGIGVRGLDRLLEDILDPSRNVDQAFRASTLLLKNEKSISGLILREEGQIIVIADAQGKEIRVGKDEVEEKRTSLLSPMPANLAETIKEEDFHNLMAYLLQQKPKAK
jgi:putative heme-binding domain-containing protein